VSLEFPVVCLADYRERWQELDQSSNPFAVAVQAHLKARETHHDVIARYQAKLDLIKSLYRRGWQQQDILELFRFIDWVLELPAGLENQLWNEVQATEEVQKVRYLSTIERMFIDRGFQKGLDEGKAEGKAELLTRLLQRRFGPLPDWVETRLSQATPAQLDTWADRVFDATLLESVFD
jgi:hypothetical protein